ncbi:recombinase family protein [Falsihalocynthiibacter arcticus]|uniref:Resolvase/invertase-type recombinase catalytic domain-containing protein n=1 Tax=Falsihalocynthiibacter arcticus TaxID=1579316 RepID=A0A126V685_9RHOB|nr:recombinase family protein [Falsihalocynthiibacter arcticus]AML53803.1 hypothetical protein RC74_21350 [Falsihalocynthiibacter arcticus]
MAVFGYARVSTTDQKAGLDEQVRRLKELCIGSDDDIIVEEISGTNVDDRKELVRLMGFMRRGDTLVTTKIDRLARSTKDLLSIYDDLAERNITIHILDMNIDTSTPTGRMIMTIIGAVAEFEVSMMKERQEVGIVAAKEAGRYKGRKPISDEKKEKIIADIKRGIGPQMISTHYKVSRATVYNIMKEAGVHRPTLGDDQ